jgi:hypothetical protein
VFTIYGFSHYLRREEKDFALKGGTAINPFVRDMPRPWVDFDLTLPPVTLPNPFRPLPTRGP